MARCELSSAGRTDQPVSTRRDAPSEAPQEQSICWRVHPARERPAAMSGALAVIAAFAWLAAEWMEAWAWGLFAAALMIGLLHRFFFPSEFRVNAEGVEARHALHRQRLRWQEIRRFVHDAHGGYLSTRVRPSTLDAFRGMHLMFDGNSEAAVARIRRGLEREGGPA
jgi:hypothetical protein